MSDSPTPTTVPALIEAFGGNARFGRVIGKAPSTVGEQKRNGSIPVEYWGAIVAAASEHGIAGLTYEALVRMHTPAERRADAEVRS